MASRASYELHHHFPKLAEESGFTFNVHRPRAHVDWHKIRSIDIESIIKDRKFYLIEQHLNDIFNCALESEFDVRILDEGVIKMFRLSQLAVEYQQFCRHYLDRSVYVLREEITSLAQELDTTKKSLHEKDEELRKLKRKTKHSYRTPLPYGNDNIATMILKTLSNKTEIFGNPSTSNPDGLQYNKCIYCEKIFLNQLYLKSHINRRHSNMLDVPQKDNGESNQIATMEKEHPKLNDEIVELRNRLEEMESLLITVNNKGNTPVSSEVKPQQNPEHKDKVVEKVIMKDAEVSTNTEINLLDKIEEWKKEEHDKYNKEINLLRTQIVEIVNSIKNKEEEKPVQNDSNLIQQLQMTIKQQGTEINVLKQKLINARLSSDNEENDKKKEIENQISFWVRRVEVQTKQYEDLLQKLNEVAQEAREARIQAEDERSRAAQLEALLQESLNKQNNEKTRVDKSKQQNSNPHPTINGDIKKKLSKRKPDKLEPEADAKILENLHRKAQELLNMRSLSSSDVSTINSETPKTQAQKALKTLHKVKTLSKEKDFNQIKQSVYNRDRSDKKNTDKSHKYSMDKDKKESPEINELKAKKDKTKLQTNIRHKMGNGVIIAPGSPVKLVRSKITEEVNNRLVTIGVDPLKSSLPKSHFKKQKMQLQQQHESKSKKNPDYQRIKHSILAYLDSNTPVKNKEKAEIHDYVSPNKISKAFSLTSVISNVKNKALSLVKSNDTSLKARRKEVNADVAKKAMALLKTPPSSVPSSPNQQRVEIKSSSVEEIRPLPRKKLLTSQKTVDKDVFTVKKKNDINNTEDYSETETESDHNHKYYNSGMGSQSQSSKSIDNLIKSPARRPSSASAVDYTGAIRKLVKESVENNLLRSQSAANILEYKVETNNKPNTSEPNHVNSSDEIASLEDFKAESTDNIPKLTKGVLKNASSTSSLNKKKVFFDMDAIQMKSVSASPSQSITEKSDNNEKFELGLVNLDGEEWDISSIENEPLKEDTKIQVNTKASPKIAELRQTIESQLARRNDTPSTALAGSINLMPTPIIRNSSLAGSNTSLGSSILDESDGMPAVNNKAFMKTKNNSNKNDSEIDISEYSLDGILNKKINNDSF